MLNIYHSNKIEVLAKQLAALCHFEPISALAAENIVVESAAMQYWLTDALSKELGVIANVEFPFPAALVWKIYRLQMPELATQSSFDRSSLVWRLFSLFSDDTFSEQYPVFKQTALNDYLSHLNDDLQRMRFCQQLAGLYDQYQIYRPDWLLQWKNAEVAFSDTAQWQSDLWQLLCKLEPNQDDRSSIFKRSLGLFPLQKEQAHEIAPRLNIFSVSTLAKSYLDLFALLGDTIDVNIFVLNPCSVYWNDIQSQKHMSLLIDEQNSKVEGHNELLALLAKQSRDYVQLLQDYEYAATHELYVESVDEESKQDASLLAHLQQDILHLRQRPLACTTTKSRLCDNDDSLSIHSCHSPLREVQVLYDHLLCFIQEHKTTVLDDIAIMVPDLERYAPFLHAVFSTQTQNQKLAYHLCERQQSEQGGIRATLLQLLQLSQNQFSREQIIAIMREPSVAAKFNFSGQSTLEILLEQLQVRFGLNNDVWFDMSHNSPSPMVSFAWQQVKTRLLASFVAPTDLNTELSFTVPGIEENIAIQAGFLCHFIDQLAQLDFNQKQPIERWLTSVENILQHFFLANNEVERQEVRLIRDGLASIAEDAKLAGFNQAISAELFYLQLESALQSAPANHFYRPGCINIATLLPLRSMPFKFIAVLGLNDGDYPRPTNNDQMDLMVHKPRQGDRNKRDEDRYLFLEALLACRQHCYFSFIGRSQIDNSERYPSLLLSELIKHIDSHYCIGDFSHIEEHLLKRHALQAFDLRYFSPKGLYHSYNEHALLQAKALLTENQDIPAFLSEEERIDPTAIDSSTDLPLDKFISAIKDPSAGLLSGLNIRQQKNSVEPESNEHFNTNGLMAYQALELIFDSLDSASNTHIEASQLCRAGLLPQSSLGELDINDFKKRAINIHRNCKQNYLNDLTYRQSVELDIQHATSTYHLFGEIERLNSASNQRLAWFGHSLHGAHIIKAWIEHLICQCSLGEMHSYLVSEKTVYKINALSADTAKILLLDLIDIMLENRVSLSWFFPKACWAYSAAQESKALPLMEEKLLGKGGYPGEWHSSSNAYAYRGHKEVLISKVTQAAERIFDPLLDVWQEMSE